MDFTSGDSELQTGPLGAELGDDALVARTVGEDIFVGSGSGDAADWVRLPSALTDANAESFLKLDPVAIADELAQTSVELTESGSSEVEGDTTTVYRLELPDGSDLLPLLSVPADVGVSATMEVDDDGRLRRLVAEPDHPGPTTDDERVRFPFPVPERSELVLWDFGADVTVEAPPSDAVVEWDDPRAGDVFAAVFDWPRGDAGSPDDDQVLEMTVPTGPFSLIAQGSWEAVTWEVWQAPGADGLVCHSVTLRPSPGGGGLVGETSQGTAAGLGPAGEQSGCGPAADLFERGEPVQVVTGWWLDADYWSMIGTAAPEVSSLRVELTDGEVIDVPVDPVSHVFALFHHEALSIARIVPDAGASASIECEPFEDGGYGVMLSCFGSVRRSQPDGPAHPGMP